MVHKPRFGGKPSFKGLGRAAGSAIGKLAIKIYECNGCRAQHKGERPAQCLACGRLDFTKIDSKAEAYRLGELRLLENAGLITNLRRQTRWPLYAFKDGYPVKVGEYWSDFDYERDGATVIEDAKGNAIDDLAKWKLRHMAAQGTPVSVITPKGKI